MNENFEIKYDTPIEVSEEQYKFLIVNCAGLIAHSKHEGKYYIKVFVMKYADYIKDYLIKNKKPGDLTNLPG